MKNKISFLVNKSEQIVESPGEQTLLDYLRNDLRLTGTKNGCNEGQCGSCTVIVNGAAKRACLVKLKTLEGCKVETIESLSEEKAMHPLQDAFIREGAVQCGFCTPGMIMSAKALLDKNPQPDPAAIKQALRHNICRCTGYAAIIRAVQAAAIDMSCSNLDHNSVEDTVLQSTDLIGASPVKIDSRDKVTGKTLYAGDLYFDNMLYGKLLLSKHPSALITGIDIEKALNQPGVERILLAGDIPGRNGFGLFTPHQPVLAEERVRFYGEPVALVLAESEKDAEAALSSIQVDYKLTPAVFSAEEGLRENSPRIHPDGNLAHHVSARKGNVDKAFAEADVIVEGHYSTPMVEHAYLEPEAALAAPQSDGTINVWTASQGSRAFQEMIAACLNLPLDKIRVIYTPAGGAFGGKEEPTIQIHCALSALLTGRPVKMILTRRESIIISTKRHHAVMHYRHGASFDGRVTAVEAKVVLDAGAYESLSKPVVFRAGVITTGPYDIKNVKTDSYGVYTNNTPAGAFRGFGSTQVAFGAEIQMDRLARELKMNPFELRRKNALAPGKKTMTGQIIGDDCGYIQTLNTVEKSLNEYLNELSCLIPGKKIGIGMASAYKNVGLGAGKNDQAGARLEIDPEGYLVLKIGAADMGQGSDTAMVQLASAETGLPYLDFRVLSNDTALTPEGGITTASRQTYISGQAVLGAAKMFKETLVKCLEKQFNLAEGDYLPAPGGIIVPKENNRLISYLEIASTAKNSGCSIAGEFLYTAPKTYPLREQADHQNGVPPNHYNIHFAYCYGTQAAVVAVDEKSGSVEVLKIIAAQDLGRAIHYQNSCCQIEGAVVMGMGYGLSEEFILKDGIVFTDTLAKLKVPKIEDIPEIEVILVEQISDGPYGAKGMGELPLNPTAPAIINAIYDAIGVRINNLPATRERIISAIK